MNLTELYDPTKQGIRAVLAGNLPTIVSIGPLTTLAREARSRFSEALTVRPLGLDVVRHAARLMCWRNPYGVPIAWPLHCAARIGTRTDGQ